MLSVGSLCMAASRALSQLAISGAVDDRLDARSSLDAIHRSKEASPVVRAQAEEQAQALTKPVPAGLAKAWSDGWGRLAKA